MRTFTCAIIDDEPLATEIIEQFVAKIPQLEIAFISHQPLEALALLNKEDIDILFLDIQMPDLNGVELLQMLHHKPFTIFTTAHQEHAFKAFELDATDYLLKPISFVRFETAVQKAIQRASTFQKNTDIKTYMFVKADYKLVKIEFEEILYIEGLKDYLKIEMLNEKHPIVTLMTMKHMETLLPRNFGRVHRSYIINYDKIKSFDRNQFNIANEWIPIGKSYEDEVDEKLKTLGFR
jgi:two-component system LytT family response regulator